MSEDILLSKSREELMVKARKPGGTICLCCDKHAQVYHRKFNGRMARILMDTFRVFERYPGGYLEIGKYLVKEKGYIAGEHGKLVWWGLLEKKPDAESTCGAKSSGLYRITQKGFDFVYGRISVPSHADEYNSGVIEWFGEIFMQEALPKKFNYQELMSAQVGKQEAQANEI